MSDYTTHPKWLALFAAVRSAPADDLPRLVAADWLDENDQPERAEFIRVQCELAKIGGQQDERRKELKRRELELWGTRGREWAEPLTELVCISAAAIHADRPEASDESDNAIEFRRGFAAGVRCKTVAWIGGRCVACDGFGYRGRWVERRDCGYCSGSGDASALGPQLVTAQPIERVVLTDQDPEESHTEWAWWNGGKTGERSPEEIPEAVWLMLVEELYPHAQPSQMSRYFSTRDTALDALSDALIAWALAQPDP